MFNNLEGFLASTQSTSWDSLRTEGVVNFCMLWVYGQGRMTLILSVWVSGRGRNPDIIAAEPGEPRRRGGDLVPTRSSRRSAHAWPTPRA